MIWYWLGLAIITLIFELSTGLFYFMVLSIAFAITGLAAHFLSLSLPISIALAAILSLAGITVIAMWHRKNKTKTKITTISDDLDIGQLVVIEEILPNGRYYVRYRGTQWEAQLKDPNQKASAGTKATIINKEANILIIDLFSYIKF